MIVYYNNLLSNAFWFLDLFLLQAEAMFQQIGYPGFITNTTALEEYFSGVSVVYSASFLEFWDFFF